RTSDVSYVEAMLRWLRRHASRRSRFFDDDGWDVNAWVSAYEGRGDARFLAAARAGFTAPPPGWGDVVGGGVWWSHERTYKNAITTELFLLAAARLAQMAEGEPGFLQWAVRAYEWFAASGLVNPDGLVNDGLDECVNNGGPTWSYNQGVIL